MLFWPTGRIDGASLDSPVHPSQAHPQRGIQFVRAGPRVRRPASATAAPRRFAGGGRAARLSSVRPIDLVIFHDFSTSGIPKCQVFHYTKSTLRKVRIVMRDPFVFQCKWSTFWPKSQKSAPFSLGNTMFSERDFRLARYQVFPRRELRKWKVKIAL